MSAARAVPQGSLDATRRGLRAGLTLGFERVRGKPLYLVLATAVVFAACIGFIERQSSSYAAADRALGAVVRLAVPLSAFAVVAICTGRRRLDEAVWCVARFGLSRRSVTLGLVGAAAAVSATLAVLLVVVTLLSAYGLSGVSWADVGTSVWIAALGGAAYAAWLGLGASFMRAGRGRWLALLGDFLLGASVGPAGLPWPRAHLRSLLGGEAVMDLPQTSSSAVLGAMVVVLVLTASLRAGD